MTVPSRFVVVASAAVALLCICGSVAASANVGQTRIVVFEVTASQYGTAGPPPNKVGHRQFGSGRVSDVNGATVGHFDFICRWVSILPNNDAKERCTGSATTADGRLYFAGPSIESAPVHIWSVTSGTGRYRAAHGSISDRDVTPTVSIEEVTLTARPGIALTEGVVVQPVVDGAFRNRANALCRAATTRLARLPRFPFSNFDPLNPDKSILPKIGRFFSGPGDARPILRQLERQLTALRQPATAGSEWQRVIATTRSELAARDEQVQAALAGNVSGFVASVHDIGRTAAGVALTATGFGAKSCIF